MDIDSDYKIIDSFGKAREIGCIQIDVENGKRLDISYKDKKGKKQYPVIIHSAVSGGIERYLYMVFDNFEKCFPIWLFPIQVRLIPVNDKYLDLCLELMKKYSKFKVRIDIDNRSESVSKRILLAKKELIPNSIVIGEKEEKLEGNIKELDKLLKEIDNGSSSIPYIQYDWPALVSEQIN